MTENGLLEHILDRLGRVVSAEEIFGADEAVDWPSGALDTLVKAGLLRRVQPTKIIECKGCEENCAMPVHVFPTEGNRPARAFISCDKRDDVGRVPVEMRRLEQWQITGALFANTLSRLLGFTQPPHVDSTGKRWTLGVLKGKDHKGQITLAVENSITLMVGGHDIPLAEVLTFNKGKLAIDKDELLWYVDKPTAPPGGSGYKPSVTRREARKLKTQKQYAAWRKAAKELRRKPQGKSERWVSRQIAKMPIANGCSAETIRKHIRQ